MEGDREKQIYFTKKNEKVLSSILDHISSGIICIDGGEVTYLNKKGREFMDFIRKDGSVQKKLNELVKNDKNFTHKMEIKKRNGRKMWIEIHGKSIFHGNGRSILLDISDITKAKRIEEKMEKALERERKFVEDISHYFFNPLCIAKGYIDLSLQNVDPETRRKLQITRDAVIRVETVVKHVVMEGQIYE